MKLRKKLAILLGVASLSGSPAFAQTTQQASDEIITPASGEITIPAVSNGVVSSEVARNGHLLMDSLSALPVSGDYTFILPPAYYGGMNDLIVEPELPSTEWTRVYYHELNLIRNRTGRTTFRGTRNPIPRDALEVQSLPSSGTVFLANTFVDDNAVLENIILDYEDSGYFGNTPVEILSPNTTIRNCYFIGDGEGRALELGTSSNTGNTLIEGNFFNGFVDGAVYSFRDDSVWRGNIFRNNHVGYVGNGSADLGTDVVSGENVFIDNDVPVRLYSGDDYFLQLNYFYDDNRRLIIDETTIRGRIDDRRTGSQESLEATVNVMPTQTSYHELFPAATASRTWEVYR